MDNIMFIRQFKFLEDDYTINSALPGREERTSREGKPTKLFYLPISTFSSPLRKLINRF
jgi:hypothetical protein